MNSKKKTRANLINGLIAGLLLFGCSCTVCNKKTNFGFAMPKIEAVGQKISHDSQTLIAINRELK